MVQKVAGEIIFQNFRFPFRMKHSADYSSLHETKPESTRMPMGEKEGCDDGKKDLNMDLGDMEEAITCYTGVNTRFYINIHKSVSG